MCRVTYVLYGVRHSALKTILGCLDTKGGSLTSCDGSQTIIRLATVAEEAITNDTSCSESDPVFMLYCWFVTI